MYDPEDEILKMHSDAELSGLYASWERIWRYADNTKDAAKAKTVMDKIADEQDRRHPGFYK